MFSDCIPTSQKSNCIFFLATTVQNIFLTKKEKLTCKDCHKPIVLGQAFVAENENSRGTCFECSPFVDYTLLPPGDAALTRRSKKHSDLCGVLFSWNQRRRRFERKGQYVQLSAINVAKWECKADKTVRAEKNAKAAIVRAEKDKEYIQLFGEAIRKEYPNCPSDRELEIAEHACEKYSGRVGRSASAKLFDKKMIDIAVEAHVRHVETNYDAQFGKGKRKKEIRSSLSSEIKTIMRSWK